MSDEVLEFDSNISVEYSVDSGVTKESSFSSLVNSSIEKMSVIVRNMQMDSMLGLEED